MFIRKFSLIASLLFVIPFFSGCGFNNINPPATIESGDNVNLDNQQDVSSDNKYTVLIRDTGDSRRSDNFAEGYDLYNQIILKNNYTKEEKVIINSGRPADLNVKNIDEFPIDILVNLSNPVFSLDNNRIFFNAAAWVTSPATFLYDINTGNLSYFAPGGIKEVIKDGEYAGNLILIQRRIIGQSGPMVYCEFIVDSNSGGVIKDLNTCL